MKLFKKNKMTKIETNWFLLVIKTFIPKSQTRKNLRL